MLLELDQPAVRLSMRSFPLLALAAAILLLPGAGHAAPEHPPFQALVDATPEGGTLLPPPGVYAGPVVIDKSINIYGGGKVVIDNGGEGTVVTLKASRSILAGLVLRNSGEHHTRLDAALQVKSHFNVIKDLVIENCLFGIDLSQANNNILRRNVIRSKDAEIGLKGDAIRVWYSMYTKIEDNVIEDVRDGILVWYSRQNEVSGNTVSGSRYGLHFMYADNNSAEGNTFRRNMVGIFSMFANSVSLTNNDVFESNGPSGIAIGLKQTSDAVITGNAVIGSAIGFYMDQSPEAPDVPNTMKGNRIAFNGVGINFLSGIGGNEITGNDFIGNFTQVGVSHDRSAQLNTWNGNYWDSYEGFDEDRDGTGDKPLELYDYADRIWMDIPPAGFFRGSPVLELIDFMERLAPFTEPVLILRDEKPAMRRIAEKPVS